MDNDEMELGHYGRIFRRSWWLIALSVVACTILAVMLLPAPRDFFESQVTVLLASGDVDGGRDNDQVSEEREIGIARSALIGDTVIERYEGSLTLEVWSENLLISACLDEESTVVSDRCDAQILKFFYRGDSAVAASTIVQLSADSYLEFRVGREEALQSRRVDNLAAQIDDLDLRINNEQVVFAQSEEASAERTLSELRLRRLESERIDARSRLDGFEGTTVSVGELLSPASIPKTESSGIPTPISAFAGLLIGLLLGAVAAVLTDRLDRRLSNAAETELDLGVPVLGNIPRITEDSPALVTALSPNAPGAEAFRRLAAAALATRHGYVVDTITVTGANEDEGRTTAAINLALALSQSGRQVLVVAGDRRNDTVDQLFGLAKAPGLNDFLRGPADLDAARALLAGGEERLGVHVLPTGTGAPPPLSSSGLSSLLAAAQERNMMVVFDSPPALTHADGLQLASIADAVYVLAAVGRTRRSQLTELRVQLLNVQADVAGAILNRSSRLTLISPSAGNLGQTALHPRAVVTDQSLSTANSKRPRDAFPKFEYNDPWADDEAPMSSNVAERAEEIAEDAEVVDDLVEGTNGDSR